MIRNNHYEEGQGQIIPVKWLGLYLFGVRKLWRERDGNNFFLDTFSGMCAEKIDFWEWWPASERGWKPEWGH